MVPRQIKKLDKDNSDKAADEVFSQRKRLEWTVFAPGG
jgi:hypothetical protein